MKRHDDVVRICAACAAGLVVCSSLPPVVRSGPALLLVLYLPGAGLSAALIGRRLPPLEKITISVALSLACCGLSALLLNAVRLLDAAGWACVLMGICLAGSSAALVLHSGTSERTKFAITMPPERAALWCLSAVLAALAVFIAARGALSQREYRFTDFWMVSSPSEPSQAIIGVRNEEARSVSYRIEVFARGALSEAFPGFVLAPGASRTFSISLPTVVYTASLRDGDIKQTRPLKEAGVQRVEARLFEDGDRTKVYRRVWLPLPSAVRSNDSPFAPPRAAKPLNFSDVTATPLPFSSGAFGPLVSAKLPSEARGTSVRGDLRVRP